MEQKVVALGFFDGVHIGHQLILDKAVEIAKVHGLLAAALTFRRHPKGFVRGISPPMITSFDKRTWHIFARGIDEVIALDFNQQTADISPMDFALALKEEYGALYAVCGDDFRFGKNAEGTPDLLRQVGINVTVCPKVGGPGGVPVSSTAIRRMIENGQMEEATALLGRPFQMEGTVVPGHKIGRRLGFPTINLTPKEELVIPKRGVYAGSVEINEKSFKALTNVGTRPTFSSADIISIESHILNFSGDLYGKKLAVSFDTFLRPERVFASAEELKNQIEKDINCALGL